MLQKIKNVYHAGQAVLANVRFVFPSRGLTVIGVTGTDGKTTTSSLIYEIVKTIDPKACLITTINAIINGKSYDTGFHVTTPDVFTLQSYMRKAKQGGAKIVVLEVTSHALDQFRVMGIDFHIGVLTNVTSEHLDYHKTYDNYVRTKAKLLTKAKIAVINRDDVSYPLATQILEASKVQTVTYGIHEKADITPKILSYQTSLRGEFNTYNILAAISVGKLLEVPEKNMRQAIKDFRSPTGRDERVYEKDFTVVVDFAHTPNAIEQILRTIRTDMGKKGRLIHVFGSAGERDQFKRPMMGELSAKYADIIILTAEDPRSEKVGDISNAIDTGIKSVNTERTPEVVKIDDRQEAIARAISLAKKGDIIVVTGKGHEQSMNFGKGEIPWDDRKAVLKALEKGSK